MRVSGQHRRHQGGRAQEDNGQSQPRCVIVGTDADRITAQQPEVDTYSLQDQQHQHRARRDPPEWPVEYDSDRQQRGDRGQGRRDVERHQPPYVSHRMDSIPEIISLSSTSETSSRRFQCTACGLAPTFSLTEVATSITESVRLANAGNLVVTTGRETPRWVSRSRCTVSIATAWIRPALCDCSFCTTCR